MFNPIKSYPVGVYNSEIHSNWGDNIMHTGPPSGTRLPQICLKPYIRQPIGPLIAMYSLVNESSDALKLCPTQTWIFSFFIHGFPQHALAKMARHSHFFHMSVKYLEIDQNSWNFVVVMFLISLLVCEHTITYVGPCKRGPGIPKSKFQEGWNHRISILKWPKSQNSKRLNPKIPCPEGQCWLRPKFG